MKAAVMRAFKTPLEIEDIQISKPGPRELLVRTVATGVCHSDLHVMDAALPVPPRPELIGLSYLLQVEAADPAGRTALSPPAILAIH